MYAVVIALGGNALLQRGQRMTEQNQRANVDIAARALAEVAKTHRMLSNASLLLPAR